MPYTYLKYALMCIWQEFCDTAPQAAHLFVQGSATCAKGRCQGLIDRCPVTSGTKTAVCHNTEPSLSWNDDDDDSEDEACVSGETLEVLVTLVLARSCSFFLVQQNFRKIFKIKKQV